MKPTAKLLSEETSEGSQDVLYHALYELLGERLRIAIRRDSYPNQSYAIVEIYSEMLKQWNPLASIHYSHMHSNRKYDLHGHWYISGHADDVRELLEKANLILDRNLKYRKQDPANHGQDPEIVPVAAQRNL